MNLEEARQRIAELSETIDSHNYKYYVLAQPSISDYDFDMLMNDRADSVVPSPVAATSPKADRMKIIRSTYAQAKQKIADEAKAAFPRNMQIVIRDQSWGPPSTTNLKFYFQPLQIGGQTGKQCYFIAEHCHHSSMGPESYGEYLFAPDCQNLIFSYSRAQEEGETSEWRYYYDAGGACIEVISQAADNDKGHAAKLAAQRYQKVFKALLGEDS